MDFPSPPRTSAVALLPQAERDRAAPERQQNGRSGEPGAEVARRRITAAALCTMTNMRTMTSMSG